MLVDGIVRVMPIIPLPGRGRADIPFDDFHTVLAEVVQRPVVVVGAQPHHPLGPLLGGGLEKEEGTACPGVAQPAPFCPVVDHNFLDRLGQDGAFLLQARRDAQGLLAVIEPKVAFGHALLLEPALGPLGFLGILEQRRQIPGGGVMPGAQGSFGRLLGRPGALLGHQRSPLARSARRRFLATLTDAGAMRLPWPGWHCHGTPSMRRVAGPRPPRRDAALPRCGSRSLGPRRPGAAGELEGAPVGVLRGTRSFRRAATQASGSIAGTTKASYAMASECQKSSAVMVATAGTSPAWTASWARTRLLAATPQWSPAVP